MLTARTAFTCMKLQRTFHCRLRHNCCRSGRLDKLRLFHCHYNCGHRARREGCRAVAASGEESTCKGVQIAQLPVTMCVHCV